MIARLLKPLLPLFACLAIVGCGPDGAEETASAPVKDLAIEYIVLSNADNPDGAWVGLDGRSWVTPLRYPGRVDAGFGPVTVLGLPATAEDAQTAICPLLLNSDPMQTPVGVLARMRTLVKGNSSAVFDLAETFPQLSTWSRDVFWGERGVRIVDTLSFRMGQRAQSTFNWELPAEGPYAVSEEENRTLVESPTAAYIIQADEPIKVTLTEPTAENGLEYTLLAIKTVGLPPELKVILRVIAR